MTAQQLLGPDGKTPLRRYAGYNGGGPGFGGQLIDWNAPQQSADAALLPNFYRGNARADDLVRNNGVASNAVQLHQDHIVGNLFKLSYRPNWRYIGISREDAGRWRVTLRSRGLNTPRTLTARLISSGNGRSQ